MKKEFLKLALILSFGFSGLAAGAPTEDLPVIYPEDVLTARAELEVFGVDPDAEQFGEEKIEQKRHPSFVKMKKEDREKMYLRFYPFYDLTRANN